ncbi:MAG: PDZ domain-containing protein [Candidatus Cloacimonetes bacterium]|nr:PDZ domain-containing protein [Candidatus Cloacimonadota bacterium]
MQGYYRMPTVHDGQVVFVSEDDLWSVSLKGGRAQRLTSNLGSVSYPLLSPDGKWIAFTGREERVSEIYVMPSEGGTATRLTWHGAACWPVYWKGEKIIFASMYGSFSTREFFLWEIGLDGQPPLKLNYGPARSISFGNKGTVLGRNTSDPARWKRYRGGTAGYLLIDRDGKGDFQKYLDLKGNIACPMWVGKRIFFISDHEGIGNIYSADLKGKDIQRHSQHKDYYARYAETDGKTIVWQAGAELWSLDITSNIATRIKIDYRSPRIHLSRKFVETGKYLNDYALSPDAGSVCLNIRGKVMAGGAWEGSIQQYGLKQGVRYSLPCFLPNDKGLLLVSDEGDCEHFELHPLLKDYHMDKSPAKPRIYDKDDYGRPRYLYPSPCGKWVAYANHRCELMLLNLEKNELIKIDRNQYGLMCSASWSADSRWIAYSIDDTRLTSRIMIYDVENATSHAVTVPVKWDSEPSFDPEGKYLFFLSSRTFTPMGDSIQYNITFQKSWKPYLITLQKDTRSPFLPEAKALETKPAEPSKDDKTGKKKDAKPVIKPVEIDFEGISDRIVEIPLEGENMGGLQAVKGKLFYYKYDPSQGWVRNAEPTVDIYCYDMEKMEEQMFVAKVSGYGFNSDASAMMIQSNKQLRIISTKRDPKTELPKESTPGRSSGWIDLTKFRVEVDPQSEWKQMFREAWRLQKYHFWTENMSNIDWDKVFKRYYPLVDRVGSRGEFSDLIWEMQGELGTSHCYEFGGDYRLAPMYLVGNLGVDWSFDSKRQEWKITRILKGDHWESKNRSPFMNPGLNVKIGTIVKEINGIPLSATQTPERCLVNLAGQPVQLTICDARGRNKRVITVSPMDNEFPARYRDWVEANRSYVHTKTKGRVGYIHIPDMGPDGLKEFHRYFLTELDYEGLVVDVRYNGGGSVSQLLLEKLARKRIGYDLTRWFGYDPYPMESPAGALVCLTNEAAGSDGDIFSHAFKLMKLGKLVGKRTWGGVIGIWPRNSLVDGTLTTQPEMSFWFKDVGWGIENYGTDPDIEVDIMPQDYANQKDPQLDTAIKVVLDDLKANPPLKPDFSGKPDLRS